MVYEFEPMMRDKRCYGDERVVGSSLGAISRMGVGDKMILMNLTDGDGE